MMERFVSVIVDVFIANDGLVVVVTFVCTFAITCAGGTATGM